MVTVLSTTIPRNLYTAHKVQGKLYFCPHICPFANEIMYAGSEDVGTFRYVFRSLLKVSNYALRIMG